VFVHPGGSYVQPCEDSDWTTGHEVRKVTITICCMHSPMEMLREADLEQCVGLFRKQEECHPGSR